MKKYLLLFLLLLVFPGFTFAVNEDSTTNPSVEPSITSFEHKSGLKTPPLPVRKITVTTGMMKGRENTIQMRQDLMQKRDDLIQEYKLKKADFQTKLEGIRDNKKKLLLLKVNNHLAEMNKNRTKKMLEALTKLSSILNKFTEKVSIAKKGGQDTTAASDAISKAETAIATTNSAVTLQAGKEYTPSITVEASLRTDVEAAHTQLQKDLEETHVKVKEAKLLVLDAAKEVMKLKFTKISPTQENKVDNSTP